MLPHTSKACLDLLPLMQVRQGLRRDEDKLEPSAEVKGTDVASYECDARATLQGLPLRQLKHVRGDVEAHDLNAAFRQGDREAAGAAGEFQHGVTVAGDLTPVEVQHVAGSIPAHHEVI